MEIVKVLSNLKIKSYFMAFMFLFTITVPGILILFHFFREIFMSFDTLRLFMLIGTIGVGIYLISFLISASLFGILLFEHKDIELIEDENSLLEGIFVTSSQLSLIFIFLLSTIFYFTHNFNFLSFTIWFIVSEFIYSLITVWVLHKLILVLKNEEKIEKEENEKAEADRILKVEQLSNEISKLKKSLKQFQNEETETRKFKFLRSQSEKDNQLSAIMAKIDETNFSIKNKEEELQKLIIK